MTLPTALRTLVFELPLPASGWWVFPHTGGDGFPSVALHIPPSGFQCVKLKQGFLKLHRFYLAWLQPGGTLPSSGCCREPPDSCPLIAALSLSRRADIWSQRNSWIVFSICSGCAGLPISISKAKLPGEHFAYLPGLGVCLGTLYGPERSQTTNPEVAARLRLLLHQPRWSSQRLCAADCAVCSRLNVF